MRALITLSILLAAPSIALAVPAVKRERVVVELTGGNKTALENIIENYICAEVNDRYGGTGVCKKDVNLDRVALSWASIDTDDDGVPDTDVLRLFSVVAVNGDLNAPPLP